MNKMIEIEGMSCDHCKMRVENILNSIDGVEAVKVDLEKKQAKVTIVKEIPNDVLREKILDIGFDVISIK